MPTPAQAMKRGLGSGWAGSWTSTCPELTDGQSPGQSLPFHFSSELGRPSSPEALALAYRPPSGLSWPGGGHGDQLTALGIPFSPVPRHGRLCPLGTLWSLGTSRGWHCPPPRPAWNNFAGGGLVGSRPSCCRLETPAETHSPALPHDVSILDT